MNEWNKYQMADEVLGIIPNKSIVNLGIGLPTLLAERVPNNKNIIIHSENGVLGVKGRPLKGNVSATLINAGKETIAVENGVSFFDSALSFGMIRGGHIDVTVLGAMEVSADGSLANWSIPGQKITGMGGAMDLVNGPKTVIVMSYHRNKLNESKLVHCCKLPLTGKCVVDYVVTNLGVFQPSKNLKKFHVIKVSDKNLKYELKKDLFNFK